MPSGHKAQGGVSLSSLPVQSGTTLGNPCAKNVQKFRKLGKSHTNEFANLYLLPSNLQDARHVVS
jgi:hypothetical protein